MNNKSIKLTYSDLPKSVYVLVFARIISSMGNFVFPFMTLLLTSKIALAERQVGLFLLIMHYPNLLKKANHPMKI